MKSISEMRHHAAAIFNKTSDQFAFEKSRKNRMTENFNNGLSDKQ